MSDITIHSITEADQMEWKRLWTGYLTFYETKKPDEVYRATFDALLKDDITQPRGYLAFIDGKACGLVHFFQHPHCWHTRPVVYLQDLFVDPDNRGQGLGRALIEAVYAFADSHDMASVYWLTADDNPASKLYDQLAKRTRFIKYQR